MRTNKTPKDKNQPLANTLSKQLKSSDKPAFQFADNRPETIAQRKIQEGINNKHPAIQRVKKAREEGKEADAVAGEQQIATLKGNLMTAPQQKAEIAAEMQRRRAALDVKAQEAYAAGEHGQGAHAGSANKQLIARLAGDLHAINTKGAIDALHKKPREEALKAWEERTLPEVSAQVMAKNRATQEEITKVTQL